jgi:MFS family permease
MKLFRMTDQKHIVKLFHSKWLRGIPRTVWALGFVSLFMDISSEAIYSLLPVFLVSVLGASALSVGFIEGVAEATALITRIFSGALSDRLGKRKLLAVTGYALGTLTKPVFAMARTVGVVFSARFVDRVGKGIRGAPRDALIADVTPADKRGAAYGMRQSLDTVGAFVGPLLAMILMLLTLADFRLVFWLAVIPGILSVFIILFFVTEPKTRPEKTPLNPLHYKEISKMPRQYWLVVIFGFIFTLSRFSEAFLLLRAESVGVTASLIPLIMIIMNVVFSITAYPVGYLSDKIGRTGLLAIGLGVLIISDLVLAGSRVGWQVGIGTALWGFHLGLTQGLLTTLVADTATAHLRGTAFGLFNLASGLAMLVASVLAGLLWDLVGPAATFLVGGGFALLALLIYLTMRHHLEQNR